MMAKKTGPMEGYAARKGRGEAVRKNGTAVDTGALLTDVEETMPWLRGFLLQTVSGGKPCQPGLLQLYLQDTGMCASLKWRSERLKAFVHARQWSELLGRLEEGLESDTLLWKPDTFNPSK